MSKYDLLDNCPDRNHPNCHISHERLKNEARIVRKLIRQLKLAGFRLTRANDGCELVDVHNETAALDVVFSVDESALGFDGPTGLHHSVMFVLGNASDGTEVISDWDYTRDDPDGFNAEMERITDELWGLN